MRKFSELLNSEWTEADRFGRQGRRLQAVRYNRSIPFWRTNRIRWDTPPYFCFCVIWESNPWARALIRKFSELLNSEWSEADRFGRQGRRLQAVRCNRSIPFWRTNKIRWDTPPYFCFCVIWNRTYPNFPLRIFVNICLLFVRDMVYCS